MRPIRVLFIAEALTLAHVVRLVTLANSLVEEGAEVWLATDRRYAQFVGPVRYPVEPIRSLSAERFFRALKLGTRIFDDETLAMYARDDLALFDRLKPDVVVGDFRLSLQASARHASIPYINLTNAYWSPAAKIRQIVPEYLWVSWFGTDLGQTLYNAFRTMGYAHHAAPVNRLRRLYGLPPLGSDFRNLLTDGDQTCFADSPQIVPIEKLSSSQHYIGPVPWSPTMPFPSWWEELLKEHDDRPVVYVNLGSSGPPEALQVALDGLEGMPVRVIGATAGRTSRVRLPANARVADLLPGDEACAVARLVICNGGSPATYQALAQGAPVIGIATNMDQFLNMAATEDAACGRLVRSRGLTPNVVRVTVARALADDQLLLRAKSMQRELATASAASIFREVMRRLIGQ